MLNKAVFIDRDGTIIFDHGYIKDPSLVELLPKVKEALSLLKKSGFMIFVVTNQSGIGRGMMTITDVQKVNTKMLELLSDNLITEILICPHAPHENCECRKPKTGLIKKVSEKYKLDLKASYAIGDKDADKELGENMGGKGIKLSEHNAGSLWTAAVEISSKK